MQFFGFIPILNLSLILKDVIMSEPLIGSSYLAVAINAGFILFCYMLGLKVNDRKEKGTYFWAD